MKFEAPVIEIQKFNLVDVISASGGETQPTGARPDGFHPGSCYGDADARDYDDFSGNCFG